MKMKMKIDKIKENEKRKARPRNWRVIRIDIDKEY